MNINQRIRALATREQVPYGIAGSDALELVPGQPFHWIGLRVLGHQPVLWGILALQMILVGMLAFEVVVLWSSGGRLYSAETRLVLLGPIIGWLYDHGVKFAFGKYEMEITGVLALLPYLFVLNVSWTFACGVVCKQRPRMRWLLAGFLGLVPLRLVAWRWLNKWVFWRTSDQKLSSLLEARLLQFSIIYMLVNKSSREEMTHVWLRALDRRFKYLTDSYASFGYIPLYVGGGLAALCFLFLLATNAFGFHSIENRLAVKIVGDALLYSALGWIVYLALNRFLLGVATFFWLESPLTTDETLPVERWQRRILLLCAITAIMTVGGLSIHSILASAPKKQLILPLPLDQKEVHAFLERRIPYAHVNVEKNTVHQCVGDGQEVKYVGLDSLYYRREHSPGGQWPQRQMTAVAEVHGAKLRYLDESELTESIKNGNGCSWPRAS